MGWRQRLLFSIQNLNTTFARKVLCLPHPPVHYALSPAFSSHACPLLPTRPHTHKEQASKARGVAGNWQYRRQRAPAAPLQWKAAAACYCFFFLVFFSSVSELKQQLRAL